MKKAIVIISSIVLLLAVIAGGIGLYIVNTPEYVNTPPPDGRLNRPSQTP